MTAAALSGGAVLCADPIATLTPLRAAYLAKIFPLINQAATPVDIYDEPFPKVWSLPISTPQETWYLAAVFNWNDHEDDVYFELDALGVPESNGFLCPRFLDASISRQGFTKPKPVEYSTPFRETALFREEQNVPQCSQPIFTIHKAVPRSYPPVGIITAKVIYSFANRLDKPRVPALFMCQKGIYP